MSFLDDDINCKLVMLKNAAISFYISIILATCASVYITYSITLDNRYHRFCTRDIFMEKNILGIPCELNIAEIIKTFIGIEAFLIIFYFLFLLMFLAVVTITFRFFRNYFEHLNINIYQITIIITLVIFVVSTIISTALTYLGLAHNAGGQFCAYHKLNQFNALGQQCDILFLELLKVFSIFEGVTFSSIFLILYLLPLILILTLLKLNSRRN